MADQEGRPETLADVLGEDANFVPDDPKPVKRVRKPKKPAKPKIDNKTRPARLTAKTDLTEDIEGLIGSLTMPLVIMGARDPKFFKDAEIIMRQTPTLAAQLNDLAQNNPAVQRVLFILINGSSGIGIGLTLTQIVIPILANHEILPRESLDFFDSLIPEQPKADEPATTAS